jgi:hypothetical protein
LIAVPGQELAFVSAHRAEVVDLSVQDSARRSKAVSGTANRPAVAEGPEVEGPHPWPVAGSKADELSSRYSQVVSMAVAAVVIAVTAEAAEAAILAVAAVAVVRARCALAAGYFAAAAE